MVGFYLGSLGVQIVKSRRLFSASQRNDSRVVLCEAIPPPPLSYHADNDTRPRETPPIATPRRLPSKLSPPPLDRLAKKEDAKKVSQWTRSTPRPSAWPFDCVLHQINSNAPIEDRGVVAILDIKRRFQDEEEEAAATTNKGAHSKKNERWLMAAVIDGHSGWQTAEYVSRALGSRVQKAINEGRGAGNAPLTAESLSEVFCRCFERLDDEIRLRIEPAFNLGHCSVAKAGATTCATFVTPSKIVVANVGDSRAYLSRGGKMLSLTNQHNAGDAVEASKLRDAHPNEEDLIYVSKPKKKEEGSKDPNAAAADSKDSSAASNNTNSDQAQSTTTTAKSIAPDFFTQMRNVLSWPTRFVTSGSLGNSTAPGGADSSSSGGACYTKGRLQLTRAFGDFYLKEAKFAVDWDGGRLLVNIPHSFPYLSRLPEVSVLSRDRARDEFLVVASDGVWDELSPDEVGSLVRNEMRKGTDLSEISKRIHLAVLTKASKRSGKTIEEMQALPPKQRREHYDDMTIAIVNLKTEYDAAGDPIKKTP